MNIFTKVVLGVLMMVCPFMRQVYCYVPFYPMQNNSLFSTVFSLNNDESKNNKKAAL